MTTRRCRWLPVLVALNSGWLAFAPQIRAEILRVELTEGDLSNDRFNPTPFTLQSGDNQLFGVLAGDDGQGSFDRDYYSVTVPGGYVLSHVFLDLYLSSDVTSFIGIQPGPTFPNDPSTVKPADLFGWTHFGPFQQGADLLPIMGAHGQGFVAPLMPGTYSLWAQQIDDFTEYTLNFVVEVPEPLSLMYCIGLAIVLVFRHSRRTAVVST